MRYTPKSYINFQSRRPTYYELNHYETTTNSSPTFTPIQSNSHEAELLPLRWQTFHASRPLNSLCGNTLRREKDEHL